MSSTPAARRGRPRQTAEDAQAVRDRIVAAAGAVFAEHGSRGLNVARIIATADIARPTFYRYFSNALAPLHTLLDQSDDELVTGITGAVKSSADQISLGVAVIDAYLTWANARGATLRPLFAELHDSSSPVSPHRERSLETIREAVLDKFAELNRPAPRALDLDALIQTFEFVVYRLTTTGGIDQPHEIDQARKTMLRVTLALLGNKDDYDIAFAVPGLFD